MLPTIGVEPLVIFVFIDLRRFQSISFSFSTFSFRFLRELKESRSAYSEWRDEIRVIDENTRLSTEPDAGIRSRARCYPYTSIPRFILLSEMNFSLLCFTIFYRFECSSRCMQSIPAIEVQSRKGRRFFARRVIENVEFKFIRITVN